MPKRLTTGRQANEQLSSNTWQRNDCAVVAFALLSLVQANDNDGGIRALRGVDGVRKARLAAKPESN
jgi:hypothetical protein